MKGKIFAFFCSLILLAASSKGQTIDGILYTNFNNYYKWRGGAFDSTLLIPQIAASIGRRPGALRYSAADSSVYSWTGTQWRRVTGGESTPYVDTLFFQNDSLKYRKNNVNYSVGYVGDDTATVVKAYVTNAEAVTITKGQVVYIFGASGDRASVKLAKNTSDTFSSKTLGIVRENIAAGQAGWVTTQGQVSGINLGAYTAGDILWLDSVAGGFTKTKPVSPLHSVFVGVVERANPGNGLIYVKPQNGVELSEVHDVLITSPTNNQVLSYTASTGIWENKSVTTALGYTPLNVTDTSAMLNGRLSGITLNTSSAIHTSPVTFSRVGGAWSGTLSLANQSGFTVFRRASGTGTPSFGTIDSSYFGGAFKQQVGAAQSIGIQWQQVDSMFAFQQAKNGIHLIDELYFLSGIRTGSTQVPGSPFGWEGINSGNAIAITDTLGTGIRMGTSTSANAISWIGHQQVGTNLMNTQTSANDWHLFTTRVKVPTLNDGTQKFYLQIGFNTGGVSVNPNGYYFIYDLDSSMAGSGKNGNWQTRTSNAAVRTWNQNYTTTAVTADTWTKLAILCNSSVVYFYVNEVLIATHTTNLLPAGSNYAPFASITKTAGTTARNFDIDYFTLDIRYKTPR